MDALYIVTCYVTLADSLQAQGFEEDVRSSLTAAEILTVGVVAARYFQNHQERALCLLIQLGYIPRLSVSRFNRRLHQLLGWSRRLFAHLRGRYDTHAVYLVDAFPLPVCKRVRMKRCRKVQGSAYLGYCEAKREWFFGYKLHWCCNAHGVPVTFTLRPARRHERAAVACLLARLPSPATIVGDAAYVSRSRAQFWLQRGRRLVAKHYGRMAPNSQDELALLAKRQIIETVHSQLESMGVQRLRARTRSGFCLKIVLSLLALIFLALIPH